MATIPSFEFQPTLPARGATLFRALRRAHIVISTHTPRTGSDACIVDKRTESDDFNPHSPHGERPVPRHVRVSAVLISTHTPRTGSDTHEYRNRI